MWDLQPPRHISTLPKATIQGMSPKWRDGGHEEAHALQQRASYSITSSVVARPRTGW